MGYIYGHDHSSCHAFCFSPESWSGFVFGCPLKRQTHTNHASLLHPPGLQSTYKPAQLLSRPFVQLFTFSLCICHSRRPGFEANYTETLAASGCCYPSSLWLALSYGDRALARTQAWCIPPARLTGLNEACCWSGLRATVGLRFGLNYPYVFA